ncbi:hypothetical protein ACFQPC_12345 [Herminiimonas glaciei]|uniref:Uncharacterized protein n=1 Tax=Herminiimonas glaciei TaxID=523788 RepID=A0ABW2ICM1_9BURK
MNGNQIYLINLMRLVACNVYASYVVHALRWSPAVQALLSGVVLNGGGSFAAVLITRALRPRIARIRKSFNADTEAVSPQG